MPVAVDISCMEIFLMKVVCPTQAITLSQYLGSMWRHKGRFRSHNYRLIIEYKYPTHFWVLSPSHMSYHTEFTQNLWCVYQGWWKHFSFGQTKCSGGILGLRRGCMKILEFRTSEAAPAGYSSMIQETLVQRSPSLPYLFCCP